MAKINPLSNLWSIVKEADLRPLAEAAVRGVNIAIIGASGTGRSVLAEALRRDPARPEIDLDTPVSVWSVDEADQAMNADFIIIMIGEGQVDTRREQEIARAAHAANRPALVFINHSPAQLPAGEPLPAAGSRPLGAPAADSTPKPKMATAPASLPRSRRRGVVRGSVHDPLFMTREFAPAVIELLPNQLMPLGRFFPFFRVPVAQFMISDTSFTNAAYAFSTALAETVAVLNIPIAMADMVILTKNQLFLIYKVGLALGYSTRWQDYVAEFGGVLGAGFVWRQIARTLVGMIPVWGIIPKTAISYAGTYTVGNIVLQWYLTGRQLNPQQIKALYMQAFETGRDIARRMLRRAPRLRSAVRPGDEALPEPRKSKLKLQLPRLALPGGRKSRSEPQALVKHCTQCGRENAAEANFCQKCGYHFGDSAPVAGAG